MDEERKDVLLPPVDIDAEKAVLGSMLKNQDARADVNAILRAEDFYLKEHQEIFRTMFDMDQKGTGIDITTVYSALKQRKTADMVGGITYLSRLMDEAIVPSNARYYAETVSDKSKMRQLITEAESIRDAAYSSELPPEDILDNAEQRILEIAHKSQRNNYVDVNDVLFENIKQLQEIEQNGGEERGIPTGFRDVDRILGGFQKTDLIILAARPGVGKTAWALNAAEYAASIGKKVMVFSLEMSTRQLGERLLSMTSSVPLENIHKGSLSMEEWEDLSAAQDSFYGLDMVIDESSVITPLEMKNKCRRFTPLQAGKRRPRSGRHRLPAADEHGRLQDRTERKRDSGHHQIHQDHGQGTRLRRSAAVTAFQRSGAARRRSYA